MQATVTLVVVFDCTLHFRSPSSEWPLSSNCLVPAVATVFRARVSLMSFLVESLQPNIPPETIDNPTATSANFLITTRCLPDEHWSQTLSRTRPGPISVLQQEGLRPWAKALLH